MVGKQDERQADFSRQAGKLSNGRLRSGQACAALWPVSSNCSKPLASIDKASGPAGALRDGTTSKDAAGLQFIGWNSHGTAGALTQSTEFTHAAGLRRISRRSNRSHERTTRVATNRSVTLANGLSLLVSGAVTDPLDYRGSTSRLSITSGSTGLRKTRRERSD
jgi:hypothetical protein